jgi:hypothetical protein
VKRHVPRRRVGRPVIAAACAVILVLVAGVVVIVLNRSGDGGGQAGLGGSTRFGASFPTPPGEDYAAALAREDKTLGHLDLVRLFYPRAPDPWPGKAPGRDLVVSFKLPPKGVLAGRYDTQMENWFSTVPANLDVYWSYFHEPENDVEAGTFTAADYRAAFVHLDELADRAHNPRLKSTLILQSYSTRPDSGRNWRDYLPDPAHVDVIAWDVYNRVEQDGRYVGPAALLKAPLAASASVGKPFAVAEFGSALVSGDSGSGRAAWLQKMAVYLAQHHAVFVCYFDFDWNGGKDDFRLKDKKSLNAWKDVSSN